MVFAEQPLVFCDLTIAHGCPYMSQKSERQPHRGFSTERISRSVHDLAGTEFDVVVVGSGYGGSIAASRMARAGFQVCVLERGREIRPGAYPKNGLEAIVNAQVDMPFGHFGSNTALYDLRVNKEIHAFVGCGLGGTSLVNANVALRADLRVFKEARWPEELRKDSNRLMTWAYYQAEQMLKPTPYPAERSIPKYEALNRSAIEFANYGGKFYRPPINITFEEGMNNAGVYQRACNDCGNCVSGCNVGAKNTTLMNYLPDAVRHGARIYTEAKVNYVVRRNGKWAVDIEPQPRTKNTVTKSILADIVILGGGTLGSTEILLRSREKGLRLSTWLGHRFTGNGDALGIGYNTDVNIQGIGLGLHEFPKKESVGPTITGIIDLRNPHQILDEAMVIQEGAIPVALAPLINWVLPFAAMLYGRGTRRSFGEFGRGVRRALLSTLCGPYTGATRNTQTYLVMSHDDVGGRMFLKGDRLRISWPHVGEEWDFSHIDKNLRVATEPLGGVYLRNPIWSKDFGLQLITVHPLGGCVMGDCAERGVVNHKGLVFDGTSGSDVHRGLYVCDGSTIPTSLGVNPLLTISALAERCCWLIARDYRKKIDYRIYPQI
jgi:cholesterol oxidase